jgi:hypothetical protein
VPHAAAGADRREDHVLGVDAGTESAVDRDPHGQRLLLPERLRRHDVLDLARADPERERAEGPVRRRVRVAADQRDAGDRQPLLRADDVHDPSPRIADAEVDDMLLIGVARKRLDHAAHFGVRRRRSW